MRKRFHGLKRPKIRADWSKWTLYNTWRISHEAPISRNPKTRTFFQQKWKAKAMTRAYHGEQIREGQWSRMFDRRLPGVVPMPPRLLASTDGSEMSAGRGSGLETRPAKEGEGEEGLEMQTRREAKSLPLPTPYMHMTYWPTERRLDTAVWRALFASSARQARQFVVHGNVRVNGKLMQTPGYLLNPGDLFSVDPERVMYATGARKFSKDSPESLQQSGQSQRPASTGEKDEAEDADDAVVDDVEAEGDNAEATDAEAAVDPGESVKEQAVRDEAEAAHAEAAADLGKAVKMLRGLLGNARKLVVTEEDLSAKRKVELRGLTRDIKRTLSRFKGTELKPSKQEEEKESIEDAIASFRESLATVIAKIPEMKVSMSPSAETGADTEASESDPHGDSPRAQTTRDESETWQLQEDAQALQQAIAEARTNPIDASKPYATPWKPRDYMRAFAFIPRYLEVHPQICSAVYLRHPVARPGLAEVPSPFPTETMQLAHNWYLRRR